MIAYKFLRAGGIGPFSGFDWPLPEDGRPGAWVEGGGSPRPCSIGVHACSVDDLPVWLGEELYVAELSGRIERARTKLVAERGRLVRRVDSWDAETAREFALVCVERARKHAEGYGADAAAAADAGQAATAAYIAAHAAAHAIGSVDGIAAERAWQARRLAERLGL